MAGGQRKLVRFGKIDGKPFPPLCETDLISVSSEDESAGGDTVFARGNNRQSHRHRAPWGFGHEAAQYRCSTEE